MELLDKNLGLINNNYKIIKLLGSGGMGNVYLAEDVKLDRFVALKTLKNLSDNNAEYIERFKNEAKSIAKLTHPNIVNIYDIGNTSDFDYMAMEYIQGKDLEKILKVSKLPLSSIIKIAKQLCQVVAFVHSKGILHRDIKTSNILVTENFNIKLTDFGIAKKDNDQLAMTQAGTILGSILYSSPEQFINIQSLNERSDLYSVGVCIYEMLTGFPPFSDKTTIQEVILSIMSEKIKLPSEYSNEIPVLFDDILTKALNKDPDKRYLNMDAMLKDIEDIEKNYMLSQTLTNTGVSITTDFLKNTLNTKIRDTRIISQIDLTNTTLNINEFIKELNLNISWLNQILELHDHTNDEFVFEDLIKKVREKDLSGKRFSGVVCNSQYYIFIHEGIFIGALDIKNHIFGEDIFNNISQNTVFNKIINTSKDTNLSVILYSTLTLQGENTHKHINSSQINLFEIIDGLNTDNYKFSGHIVCQLSKDASKDKYLFVYNNGDIIYTFKLSQDHISIINDLTLEEFLKKGNIIINIIKPTFSIPENELKNIMAKSEFILRYKDMYDGTLSEIIKLDKGEVSHCLAEAVKNNIYFDVNLNCNIDKVQFLGEEIDIKEFVKDTDYYRVSLWIVTEFLFLLNTTNNISYFKDLYRSSSEIIKFSILDELIGYYGCSNEYSIVAKDSNGKVIFLARFGNGSKEDIELFMEETILVKKKLHQLKHKELYSAFYISDQKIDNLSLGFYYKNVKQESGIFNKAKSYVKISLTDGFNVLMVQNVDNEISLVAPNLFQA